MYSALRLFATYTAARTVMTYVRIMQELPTLYLRRAHTTVTIAACVFTRYNFPARSRARTSAMETESIIIARAFPPPSSLHFFTISLFIPDFCSHSTIGATITVERRAPALFFDARQNSTKSDRVVSRSRCHLLTAKTLGESRRYAAASLSLSRSLCLFG